MGITKACGKLVGEAVELVASSGAAVKHSVSATTACVRGSFAPQPVALDDSPRPAVALAPIASSEPNAELQVKLKEAEDRLAQMSTLQQELEFGEQQRAEASQRAAALQQQLEQAGEAVEAAQAEVSSLKGRCDEIEDARHALTAEALELRDASLRLDVLQEEHAAALKELEQTRAAREELNAELRQLREANKAQQAQLGQQQPAVPEVSMEGRTAEAKRLAVEAEPAAGEVQREPEQAEPAATARGEPKAAHKHTVGNPMPPSEADARAPQRPERQRSGSPQEPARQPGIPCSAPAAAPEDAGPAADEEAAAASDATTAAADDEVPENRLAALEQTLARHADARARLRALQAICTIADRPAVLANLLRALSDGSPVVRRTAVTRLGLMDAREALPELCSVIHDPDVSVRTAYARALARCGGDAAVQPLVALLEDRSVQLRAHAFGVLKQMAEKTFGYSPTASVQQRAAAAGKWRKWAANQARRRGKSLRAERTG